MPKTTTTTMDQLMKNVSGDLPIRQLRRGDIVEGVIIELNEREALVDVGAKSEGVIPQSEIKGTDYKVGDKVLVYVKTPEDRRGQMIVSLDRAETAKSWIDLQDAFKNETTLEFTVTGHNRGGLIGLVQGLDAFVPFSHTESASDLSVEKNELQSALDKMNGQVLRARIIELDRDKNRIILSEKEATIEEALEERREKVLALKLNDIVTGIVSAVMPYGLMLRVGDVEGLVAREELTWDENMVDEMLAEFSEGQEVSAEVIEIDNELGKVKLSMKNISTNPWEDIAKDVKVGDTLDAKINRITSYGVFALVRPGIEGLIALSSVGDDAALEVGKEVSVEVSMLDSTKRRLDLLFKGQNSD
ncbi:S1 RNA-binding domain-containing protein [candidate division WWE3 bacterium]|uniref:S1 RNA-binding domain-containing protein n=1 Tax=candidate division WWE3 bacterium TaxID=2053526 RepID=A0A955RR99_UNCKA|nr:S1 RNA-binding domain-containing protein [candidate division WWE3 bacterium]